MYSDKLSKQVPIKILDPLYLELYNALGDELQSYNDSILDVQNQFSPYTVTWWVSAWEQFLGIPVDNSILIEQRRAKILSKILGQNTITKSVVKQICATLGFNDVGVDDAIQPNNLVLSFPYKRIDRDISKMDAELRNLIPAHLGINYSFVTYSWGDIAASKYTFDNIRTKKYLDFAPPSTSATINKTPYLKLYKWEDSDAFSYLDFNQNWNLIDTALQAHSHNGSNSSKLGFSSILQDISSTINQILALTGNSADQKSALNTINGVGSLNLKNLADQITAVKKYLIDEMNKISPTGLNYNASLASIANAAANFKYYIGSANITDQDMLYPYTAYDSYDLFQGRVNEQALGNPLSNVIQLSDFMRFDYSGLVYQRTNSTGWTYKMSTSVVFTWNVYSNPSPWVENDIVPAANLKYDSENNVYTLIH